MHDLSDLSALSMVLAQLSAPFHGDYCTIHLGDLQLPWEMIAHRVRAASAGGFVIACFLVTDPVCTERLAQLMLLLHERRAAATPLAFLHANRTLAISTLGEFQATLAHNLTLLLIGQSPTAQDADPLARRDLQTEQLYPLTLTKLHGALVVVVGGGAVAERKVRGLCIVGAAVRVISPAATPALQVLANEGTIVWWARPYRPGDLAGARLVFTATDQRAVNAQVASAAAELGVWCNVADDAHAGDFHVPAVHREPDLLVAVSSAGSSPRRAQYWRDQIAAWLSIHQSIQEENERRS